MVSFFSREGLKSNRVSRYPPTAIIGRKLPFNDVFDQ